MVQIYESAFIQKYLDVGIKSGVVLCNTLAYILLDANSSFDLIDKGGVIALLLLVTYTLWRMVKTKDETIKENYEKMLKDKDSEIQYLKDELTRKP